MIIRTNLSSLVAQQNQSRAESALGTSIERLASGMRINSAKDDAAGQAIANRFTANIKGLGQAARNTNDGISMSQTAQGTLDEINHRLQRIRELSVQGLNGIYNGETGDAIQAEINLNLKEIDRLNHWASFNGIPLLDGTAGTRTLQVGAHDQDTLPIDLGPPGFSVEELGLIDLNIQGSPNNITPVSVLTGSSSRIPLESPSTTVTYTPPDNNPNLVRLSSPSTSREVIQLNGTDGRLTEVSINASHDTSTKLSNVSFTGRDAVVVNTAQESISNWTYLDDSGNTLSLSQLRLVRSAGKYWLEHQYNGGTYYFEAELTIHGDQQKITVQAKSDMRVAKADMGGGTLQQVNYAPAVPLSTADYSLTLDSNDELGNNNLKLVHVGGYYYVEENLGSDKYAYFKANVTIKTGGAQNIVTVDSSRTNKISTNDQPYVNGTTTAYLDPADPDIKVNYEDLSGKTHLDVMRADENGDHVFNINEFTNGEGAYKTAEVVRNQDGRYMLKTLNGTAEVVLYYPLYTQNSSGSYQSSYSVSTNVETGITTITMREADVAQRLRTPANPLEAIDQAIARVDAKRSQLGALDNRLESVINTNIETSHNLMAARSRIEDADYALEVSNMTRAQILQQAGTSVLAKANQLPQGVLSLLQ